MQTISKGYHGLSLLFTVMSDRLMFAGVLLIALLIASLVGQVVLF